MVPDICFKVWEYTTIRPQRRIVSAANRFTIKETGEVIVIPSARHFSPGMCKLMDFIESQGLTLSTAYGDNQGFIDQFDDYHTREEAVIIAYHAGQLIGRKKTGGQDELFSEDLY